MLSLQDKYMYILYCISLLIFIKSNLTIKLNNNILGKFISLLKSLINSIMYLIIHYCLFIDYIKMNRKGQIIDTYFVIRSYCEPLISLP